MYYEKKARIMKKKACIMKKSMYYEKKACIMKTITNYNTSHKNNCHVK